MTHHVNNISSKGCARDISPLIQPVADRVAQHLQIISKNFQFSTGRTRIYHFLLDTNRESHGQNSGSLKKFQKSSQDSVPIYLQSAVCDTTTHSIVV